MQISYARTHFKYKKCLKILGNKNYEEEKYKFYNQIINNTLKNDVFDKFFKDHFDSLG